MQIHKTILVAAAVLFMAAGCGRDAAGRLVDLYNEAAAGVDRLTADLSQVKDAAGGTKIYQAYVKLVKETEKAAAAYWNRYAAVLGVEERDGVLQKLSRAAAGLSEARRKFMVARAAR